MATIPDNDIWRRLDVERDESGDGTQLVSIFSVANPKDPIAIALGIRIASPEIAAVIDDLFNFLISRYRGERYGDIFEALDEL